MLVVITASGAVAQETTADGEKNRGLVWDITRSVVLDPTTYAAPVIVYTGRELDWKTSQRLFNVGYIEANPAFTISGQPNDVPIGYAAGNRKILAQSLGLFGQTITNNVACGLLERWLMARAPHRRKLIRTLGWIERGAFTSVLAYRQSSRQYQQWRTNVRMANEIGAP